jgi:hypothetical protein
MCTKTRFFTVSLAFFAVAGCGGEGVPPGDSPDMAVAPPDLAQPDLAPPVMDMTIPLRDPASHPDQFTVGYNGGRVLKNVDIITVVWGADPLAQQRADFASWLVQSPYIDLLAEYNVGRGTAEGPFAIMDAPPKTLDDSAVGPLLRAKIMDGTLPMPQEDSLYMLYLPAGTTSTMQGGQGCQSYGGYHWMATSGFAMPKHLAYAIIPKCSMGMGQFNSDTFVGSHEIVEAITDAEGTGWVNTDTAATESLASEIGDLCDPLRATYPGNVIADGGAPINYRVTRFFSAKNAMAGNVDPCVPVPAMPYLWFNAGADPSELDITVDPNNDTHATLKIEPFAVGGDVGPISWQIFFNVQTSGIALSQNSGMDVAGATIPIDVTVDPNALPGNYPFTVSSKAGTYRNVWYGVIVLE